MNKNFLIIVLKDICESELDMKWNLKKSKVKKYGKLLARYKYLFLLFGGLLGYPDSATKVGIALTKYV